MAADQTPTVRVDDAGAVDRTVAALAAGAAVILPTDTVYGLAVLATFPGAAAAVFALKQRPRGVPLAVLIASRAQAKELAAPLPDLAVRLAERWWPGPLTLVVPRRPGLDVDLGGDPATVGLRCPDQAFVRAVAAGAGPVATTSANRHGSPTPVSASQAAAALAGPVALVVDGGTCDGVPSTVVDCTGTELRVLRQGAIPYSALRSS